APAETLLKAIYVKVLQAGGHPYFQASFSDMNELFFQYASDEQIRYVSPPTKLLYDTYDVMIRIGAENNTKALSNVDPAKLVASQQSRTELLNTFLQRASKKEVRWTATLYPTNAYAQDAEMSLTEYEDFVYMACLGDPNDPIGYWKKLSARQQKVVDWLKGKKSIHVTAPETDLTLNIEGRTFINCSGHENVPDGEVFTGPVEDSMSGHVCFSYPAIENGHEVSGVRLWFEKGKVVKATAEKNEEFLLKTLDTDEGARRIGEFAFGTNTGISKFTRQILYDEKIGGSFHMALGTGYPETGSKNVSAIHWDMICDMRQGGEVTVDGELFYKNGQFVI
ncbi:MAG: aminopeptidase, partial [Dehalococcoidales bacterium]|nr:aminopeptidase [Dehalococcoidales bacterium]